MKVKLNCTMLIAVRVDCYALILEQIPFPKQRNYPQATFVFDIHSYKYSSYFTYFVEFMVCV